MQRAFLGTGVKFVQTSISNFFEVVDKMKDYWRIFYKKILFQ